jgi:D-alanine-D-alanine ligase
VSVPGGQRVGVIFGGPSVEHDVSILTAQQVIAVLQDRHAPVALFIDREGRWWTGEDLRSVEAFATQPPHGGRPVELRLGGAQPFVEPSTGRLRGDRPVEVDIVLNAIHGTGGEDGALLGALELAKVPYAGRGVAAAAVGMDKHLAKVVLAAAGIDVLEHRRIERSEWESDRQAVLRELVERLGGTVVVKPCTLGSSIGVQRCAGEAEIEEALELAFELDRQAIVEPFAEGATELNVAVVGRPGGPYRVSEVERPLGGEDGLSFEDKYMSAGGKGGGKSEAGGSKASGMASQDRVIPADIDEALRERVRDLGRQAHAALRLAGIVRYDFFVLGDRVVLNEPNTVPGSFAFYLFEAADLPVADLVDELLGIAIAEAREERSTTRVFESALLGMHVGARR